MNKKTSTQIKQDMIDRIKTAQPNITTRVGSVTRDVFITPSAEEMAELYTELEEVSESQSPLTAIGDNLVELGKNFNIFRKGAYKALGSVTFYTSTAPTSNITIPIGTIVSTRVNEQGRAYRFLTLQAGVMYSSYSAQYLNATTGNYEITLLVRAEDGGDDYNVGSLTITSVISSVTGIIGVYNSNAITGGADEESLVSLKNRIIAYLTGITIGTGSGYYNSAFEVSGVEDVLVIGPNDDEMERKYAGGVDVFVKGEAPYEVTETFILSSAVPPDLVVSNQPVMTEYGGTLISSTKGVMVYETDWVWERDTGVRSNSTQGLDKISWLTSETDLGTITVTYTYNSLIYDVQVYFGGQSQKIVTADVLARWASPVYIDCGFRVRVADGYASSAVLSSVEDAVTALLDDYSLGQEVQQSDIIAEINDTEGVDDVVSPLDSLEESTGTYIQDAYGNISIPSRRYAKAGTITATAISG